MFIHNLQVNWRQSVTSLWWPSTPPLSSSPGVLPSLWRGYPSWAINVVGLGESASTTCEHKYCAVLVSSSKYIMCLVRNHVCLCDLQNVIARCYVYITTQVPHQVERMRTMSVEGNCWSLSIGCTTVLSYTVVHNH